MFEVGRLALLDGDFARSAAAFAAVRDVLTGDGPVQLSPEQRGQLLEKPELVFALIGESFLRDGRWDDAAAMFRQAHQEREAPEILGFRLARVEQGRGHLEKSLEHLDRYFTAETDAAGLAPYELLAELLNPATDPPGDAAAEPNARLLEKLQKLIAQKPNDLPLGYFLAGQLRAAGRLKESEALYRKLLKRGPTADALVGLTDILFRRREPQLLLMQLGETIRQTNSLAMVAETASHIAADRPLLDQLSDLAQGSDSDQNPTLPTAATMALAWLNSDADQMDQAWIFFRQAMASDDPQRGAYALELAFKMFEAHIPNVPLRHSRKCWTNNCWKIARQNSTSTCPALDTGQTV